MSFNLELGPVPGGFPGPTQLWLEQLRQRLNFMVLQLNTLGCGLYFDADGNLAVKHDDSTIVCDDTTGLSVDPAAVDHGLLSGLGDDDHTQYLKEKRLAVELLRKSQLMPTQELRKQGSWTTERHLQVWVTTITLNTSH